MEITWLAAKSMNEDHLIVSHVSGKSPAGNISLDVDGGWDSDRSSYGDYRVSSVLNN